MTFTISNVTLLKNEPFMSYQRFKKGDLVAKNPFLAKNVQKLLSKRMKNGLFFFKKKAPFLNRQLLRNGSFIRKVTFHMVNVKRVVL